MFKMVVRKIISILQLKNFPIWTYDSSNAMESFTEFKVCNNMIMICTKYEHLKYPDFKDEHNMHYNIHTYTKEEGIFSSHISMHNFQNQT